MAANNNFLSVEDFLSIGIGPSSSHTCGPMSAAYDFVNNIELDDLEIKNLRVDLYGSLALTGKGHGTEMAVINGLSGYKPENINPDNAKKVFDMAVNEHKLDFNGVQIVSFDPKEMIVFNHNIMFDVHSNVMKISIDLESKLDKSLDKSKKNIFKYYASVGGGFIKKLVQDKSNKLVFADESLECSSSCENMPYAFNNAKELKDLSDKQNISIADIMRENEKSCRPDFDVDKYLLKVWSVMLDSIRRGCGELGDVPEELPGGLKVKRRAPGLLKKLKQKEIQQTDQTYQMSWVSLYALAVNEENASLGKIVTAPTNGAAGIIPAVLSYYVNFISKDFKESTEKLEKDIIDFLLTASAIGMLFKMGASISAAEVGCQGEVGVACSMAAAGLCSVMGGSVAQIQKAAEMGMEHHLGLTCDPVGGLVQIPCIERNVVGSVTAINLARLSILEDREDSIVSLDAVIEAMRKTGADMKDQYKETALGGLAKVLRPGVEIGKHIPEC